MFAKKKLLEYSKHHPKLSTHSCNDSESYLMHYTIRALRHEKDKHKKTHIHN